MKLKIVMVAAVFAVFVLAAESYAGYGDLTVTGNFNLLPAGAVVMYGGATVPSGSGWLLADGSAVSRTTYATLFAAIGTTYGAGNGSTTFNLPDFRGIFPRGAGTTDRTAGKDASGNFYNGGALGSYKTDRMQGHKHNMSMAFTLSAGANVEESGGTVDATGTSSAPVGDGTNGAPRTGHTTEPQSLGVNFIIKY